MRRAKLFLDIGDFDRLEEDIKIINKYKPDHNEIAELKNKASRAKNLYDEALNYFREKDFAKSKKVVTEVIGICPFYEKALLLRAKCNLKLKIYSEGIEDTTRILKLTNGNLDALAVRAKLFQYIGDVEHSKMHLKLCIDYDTFNDECKDQLEDLNNFEKYLNTAKMSLNNNPLKSIESLDKCLSIDSEWDLMMLEVHKLYCKAYIKLKDGEKALKSCDDALKYNDRDSETFILKGEAYQILGDHESAVREMKNAVDVDQESNYARQKLFEAQKLLKMSKRKDYYKILDVEKTATTAEIKRAFRKMAMKYHPDKNPDPEAKSIFNDINEANEVLSDPEKRLRYDNGEDLDNDAHYHNPFSGNPFFNFHFHRRNM